MLHNVALLLLLVVLVPTEAADNVQYVLADAVDEDATVLARHLLDRNWVNVAHIPTNPANPQFHQGTATPRRALLAATRPLQVNAVALRRPSKPMYNNRPGLLEVAEPRPLAANAATPKKPIAPRFRGQAPTRALLLARPFEAKTAAPVKPKAPKFGSSTGGSSTSATTKP